MTLLIRRRPLLLAGLAAAWPLGGWGNGPPPRHGRIMAIGGAEDRLQDRTILRRFIALSGGRSAAVVVLTAASADPLATWVSYEAAFRSLGVADCALVDARSQEDADDPEKATRLARADGIFITGGDQRRLMATLRGSAIERSLWQAFDGRGACIAGTSAGAGALSHQMLAEGSTLSLPERHAARIEPGLGLVPKAIIDQHFSQRRRLGRLLSVVAECPDNLGVGVDEDTALVIERGSGVEVLGKGAVTVVDGRRMQSNIAAVEPRERLELLGLRLHLLSAGKRYALDQDRRRPMPASLREALLLLVAAPIDTGTAASCPMPEGTAAGLSPTGP